MGNLVKGVAALLVTVVCACAAETITMEPYRTVQEEHVYTDAEVDLIARVVQAEYGNGDELDKRLVVAVILNRFESEHPDFVKHDTIEKVCTASGQFAIAKNATLETKNAVYKEIAERTDYRVLWFSSAGYQPYGERLFERNGHYFTGKGD